ncbi:hypothetical protein A5868_001417, partial [Enterococcus sp. 12F9_DIV0723]
KRFRRMYVFSLGFFSHYFTKGIYK